MWLGGAAASGHILLWVLGRTRHFYRPSGYIPPPPSSSSPSPSLSFLLHCTLTYSCRLSLHIPVIVHLPRRWLRCQALFQRLSFSEIHHRGYAQVPPSFSMQSRHLEPFRTRDLCKELAAQTTIHLPLICSLRFVCPDPLIIVTALAWLTVLWLTCLRWDFVFAHMLLRKHRCRRSQTLHHRSTHYCSVPASGHAYMHDRKRNELRDWRGTGEDIHVGIHS